MTSFHSLSNSGYCDDGAEYRAWADKQTFTPRIESIVEDPGGSFALASSSLFVLGSCWLVGGRFAPHRQYVVRSRTVQRKASPRELDLNCPTQTTRFGAWAGEHTCLRRHELFMLREARHDHRDRAGLCETSEQQLLRKRTIDICQMSLIIGLLVATRPSFRWICCCRNFLLAIIICDGLSKRLWLRVVTHWHSRFYNIRVCPCINDQEGFSL